MTIHDLSLAPGYLPPIRYLEQAARAYVATALWADADEDGPQPPEMDANGQHKARYHVLDFCARLGLDKLPVDPGYLGHNLWLNRNGHGVGFWSTEHPRAHEYDDLARAMGLADLYRPEGTRAYDLDDYATTAYVLHLRGEPVAVWTSAHPQRYTQAPLPYAISVLPFANLKKHPLLQSVGKVYNLF